MPFGLPEYDQAFALFIRDTVNDLARVRSPLLSQIPTESWSGTASTVVDGQGGEQLDLPERSVGFSWTMDTAAVARGDLDSFAAEISTAADELGPALVGMVIDAVKQVTESVGNVVKADGELRFEHFYEMLERMEWSLTDDGELSMPQIVMHPDALKKFPAPTAEQEEAVEELKRRKHKDLLARRRSRRLS